jgi:hypothetical protein
MVSISLDLAGRIAARREIVPWVRNKLWNSGMMAPELWSRRRSAAPLPNGNNALCYRTDGIRRMMILPALGR